MTSETPAPPAALGDFFKAKAKKKIKSSNLNNSNTSSKPEGKKQGKKDTEEDGWEEQEVVAATIKVEVAGKLTREEDTKEENTNAPAWGSLKNKSETSSLSDKKFPSLQKAVQSSNINIDDGSNPTINIKTSKNAFSALENSRDSDDDEPKRPTEIKPAMVKKKKGEFEKVAVQREVDKYAKKEGKKKQVSDDDEDDEDDADEEEEQVEAKAPNATETKKKKKAEKREEKTVEATEEIQEDLKIQPDLAACKAKYARRRKLPAVELPPEELEEKKAPKASAASVKAAGGKKKRMGINDEEDDKKKLLVLEE